MVRGKNRIRMLAKLIMRMESIMEKRNIVHAVHAVVAESLVFESNFGLAAVPATNSGNEAVKRAQWIPAWSAAALVWENVTTSDTTTSPNLH